MSDINTNLVIEAVGLSKIFRDFWGRPKAAAVNKIDFSVKQGEVIGFLGPNGSGKSTTIKMMLGLLYPTSGSLRVFGRNPSSVVAKQRIGYLPEETYLYRYLTAEETLDFFGALFNLPQSERRNRSRQLLEMVGLAHAAQRPVGEFSKGMARRIGIAQALINDPDLIILDEPTSGLDPIGCRKVKEIIRLLAARKKTVILCSHLLADVEDVCDNVLIMYGGRIRARGSMEELLTVEDKTRIVTPTLSPDIVERIMTILNETMQSEQVAVDHPSLDLESYFIDVVRQAREESQTTSGTAAEGRIANYLAGGSQETGEALLRQYTAEAQAQRERVAKEAEEAQQAEEAEAKPKPDLSRLQDLSASPQEEAPSPPTEEKPTAPQPRQEPTQAEKEAANKKIQDLLNKKK